jgi:hypothetical protein
MKTIKKILEDESAPATALLAIVVKEYGNECFDWDPTLLKAELQRDHDCEISDLQSDKLQAAITILTTDMYESNIAVFESLNYLLNHQHAHLDELNPLEAEELICGLTEAYVIKGEKMEFSPEVRVYAGIVFHDYGMHKPPTLFPQAIMQERDGDDTNKNEALEEIFNEKIKVTEEYLKQCTL